MKFSSATALALASVAIGVGNAEAAEVTGLWKTPVQGGLIRIERCGEEICGRSMDSVVLRVHPDRMDVKNPDPALRSRLIKGMLILKARPTADGRWSDGWIYNPNDGKTYHLSLQLDGPTRLKITGCLVAPFCASQTWTRGEAAGG